MDVSWTSQVLPSLHSPTCYSSLSQTYDGLLDSLKMEDDSTASILTVEKVQRQRIADYLRALHLTCQIMIGILDHGVPVVVDNYDTAASHEKQVNMPQNPAVNRTSQSTNNAIDTSSHPHHQKQRLLDQTKRRTELLLNVLWEQSGSGDEGLPESEHAILQRNDNNRDKGISVLPLSGHAGLYTYNFFKEQDGAGSESDDDGGELLTFDRKALEAEEKILILMASTPIPDETAANEDTRGTEMAAQEEPTVDEEDNNWQAQLQDEWQKEVYEECQERRAKRQRVS